MLAGYINQYLRAFLYWFVYNWLYCSFVFVITKMFDIYFNENTHMRRKRIGQAFVLFSDGTLQCCYNIVISINAFTRLLELRFSL